MTDSHEQDWEEEDVEVSRPVGTVVSVRLRPDVAEALLERARQRGTKVSTIVREAVETFLSGDGAVPASLDITVSSVDVPVSLYSGRSVYGHTVGGPSTLELTRR
jgi:hypothetical protein